MSLSRSLLNGNFDVDMTLINPAKYTADCGAHVIAMESVAELHEIFLEDYNYEQADLAAISEGVELEGSRYEAVAEASVQGAFDKIKAFFKKLWAKIKEFFHNIVRYFDAIFKSGKEFVTKYKKDIDSISEVKDLVMSLHNFNDSEINGFEKKTADVADSLPESVGEADKLVKDIQKDFLDNKTLDKDGKYRAHIDQVIDEYKKTFNAEQAYRDFTNNKADDLDEFKKQVNASFYSNNNVDDSEVDVNKSMVTNMVKALTSSSKPNYNSLQSKIDNAFKKVDNVIKQAETATEQYKSAGPKFKEVLSALSSYYSTTQTCLTTMVSIHKSVWAKRDAEYKHVIVSALSHSKKK